MTTGGVFTIITNDGKADRILMATGLLNSRIKKIMCARSRMGFADPTPTLVDIERTHVLYVNAHFKPFAAIGFEYIKCRPASGTAHYGGTIQFSIPQYGDFFNDMVVNVTLGKVSATPGTVPNFPPQIGNVDFSETPTRQVSAKQNTVDGVYTKYTYEYVDIAGNVLSVGSPAQNFVRYAEYPGQRLFRQVKFDVGGNPLDQYDSETMIFYQKFMVGPHKLTSWKRLVGQEVPIEAYSDLVAIKDNSNFPVPMTELVDADGDAYDGAAALSAETARKMMYIVNGPQTPKLEQPELDLWIPLLFWFCKDPRLSIPSVSIPFGQRFITIDLESQNNIVFTAPGNLFLRLTVEQQTSAGTDAGTAGALAVSDVKKWVTLTPVLAKNSEVDRTQQITNVDLYINNIFVNTEIHDIYIRRIGFSLVRVHRVQKTRVSVSTDNVLLSQLKWPIETMFIGLRPTYNTNHNNPNQYRDWHRMALLTDNVIDVTSKASVDVMIDDTVAFNAASEKHKTASSQIVSERIVYPTITPTIDTLKLQAHGINIYDSYKSAFFSDYVPYTFGGTNITAPEDRGACMISLALFPGTYQPSGHINVSRAREFYLQYTSSVAGNLEPCDFIVVARALNFLLISDGNAVLRYST